MGEVEHVEVVEVGKDLPLDRAQLVPRQPVMVVVEGYNQAHHTIVKRNCQIFSPLRPSFNHLSP